MKQAFSVDHLPDIESDECTLWRYMDFTKFVSLLDTSSLYFSRSDRLGDHFEGSYPRANIPLREESVRQLEERMGHDLFVQYQKRNVDLNKFMRTIIFLNCWHINEHESAAMWQLYTKTNESIAMRSSYKRLGAELHKRIIIKPVQYIDFEKDMIPEANKLFPFFFKRKSFEHERELRAAIFSAPGESEFEFAAEPSELGIFVKVELQNLVERIMVAPSAQDWFFALVESVASRYGVSVGVERSSLDEEPFF